MATDDAYQQLAARHGYEKSQRYRRILEFLLTPQQAKLAVALPGTPQELAERTALDPETISQELALLFKRGVVFPRHFQTLEHCRFARSVMQLHDASQSLWRLDIHSEEEKRHLWELWEDFLENEWNRDLAESYRTLEPPPSRIIPAYRSISHLPDVLPEENALELIKAQQSIAVVSCTCRKRRTETGKPCDKSHDLNCLQFNRSAEYCIARGHGRALSLDEAMELIQEIEEDGLVHTWGNGPVMTYNVMCNCCRDCCIVLHPMDQYQVPWTVRYAKSRYEARVDPELCNGCQDCLDRCQFDAISMQNVEGYDETKAVVDPQKCMGCGVCTLICGLGALEMQCVRPPEHILAVGVAPPAY